MSDDPEATPPDSGALDSVDAAQHHPLETYTDLPLPPCGNSGSDRRPDADAATTSLLDLMARLDEALLVPLAPPLHDADFHAVRAWAEQATEGFSWRRDRTNLIREVDRILHDEFRTARTVDLLREKLASQAERQREMQDGTYWQQRDRGRRAQQPTHVDVDPDAWQRAKALGTRQGVGIGDYVGRLVAAELRAPSCRRVPSPAQTRRLFARLAIDKDDWRTFVADTHEAGLTVQRRIGLLVERL